MVTSTFSLVVGILAIQCVSSMSSPTFCVCSTAVWVFHVTSSLLYKTKGRRKICCQKEMRARGWMIEFSIRTIVFRLRSSPAARWLDRMFWYKYTHCSHGAFINYVMNQTFNLCIEFEHLSMQDVYTQTRLFKWWFISRSTQKQNVGKYCVYSTYLIPVSKMQMN